MSELPRLSPAKFLACSVHVPEQMRLFLAGCCLAALKRAESACRFDFVASVDDDTLIVPVLMPAYDEHLMNIILDATLDGRLSAMVRTVVVGKSGMQNRVVYALDDGRVVAQLFAGRGDKELIVEIGEPDIEHESSTPVMWLASGPKAPLDDKPVKSGQSIH